MRAIRWTLIRGPMQVSTKAGLVPLKRGDFLGWDESDDLVVLRAPSPVN